MVGTKSSFEFRWRRWALLRDVVVTHLENGVAGSRYRHFTSIGSALGVSSLEVPAAPLERELLEIRTALANRPISDLVLGPATAKVLNPDAELAVARPLTRTELSDVAPIGADETLGQYFASMIDSMLEVCAEPDEDGVVEVHDG